MTSPHEVLVAHQRRDVSSCMCGWAELGQSFCQHQLDMLAAAGLVIVPRPSEDRVEAALEGFEPSVNYSDGSRRALERARDYRTRDAMTAALAAAEAADTRPRELHDELMRRSGETAYGDPYEIGKANGYVSAYLLVARTFNLPEVNGDGA